MTPCPECTGPLSPVRLCGHAKGCGGAIDEVLPESVQRLIDGWGEVEWVWRDINGGVHAWACAVGPLEVWFWEIADYRHYATEAEARSAAELLVHALRVVWGGDE